LAFIRTGRFELPFSRSSLLLRNLRGELESVRFLMRRTREWTTRADRRINSHAAR
jgi:hypothetical protein